MPSQDLLVGRSSRRLKESRLLQQAKRDSASTRDKRQASPLLYGVDRNMTKSSRKDMLIHQHFGFPASKTVSIQSDPLLMGFALRKEAVWGLQRKWKICRLDKCLAFNSRRSTFSDLSKTTGKSARTHLHKAHTCVSRWGFTSCKTNKSNRVDNSAAQARMIRLFVAHYRYRGLICGLFRKIFLDRERERERKRNCFCTPVYE